MPYTTEDGGRLNNFAREPKIYQEETPTATDQRNYILWGIAAATLVGVVVFVAFAVSNVS